MIWSFIAAFFLTFVIVRVLAYILHDAKGYGTKRERSWTLTGYLRVKTGYDWHHFHLGSMISIIVVVLVSMLGANSILLGALGVGVSMIIDQSVPIIDRKSNYFHIKNLVVSFIFHALVAVLAVIIYFQI